MHFFTDARQSSAPRTGGGDHWTLGHPTYWTVASATTFRRDGTNFPSRMRGTSGKFLLGGILTIGICRSLWPSSSPARNVAMRPSDFPEDMRAALGSLSEAGPIEESTQQTKTEGVFKLNVHTKHHYKSPPIKQLNTHRCFALWLQGGSDFFLGI